MLLSPTPSSRCWRSWRAPPAKATVPRLSWARDSPAVGSARELLSQRLGFGSGFRNFKTETLNPKFKNFRMLGLRAGDFRTRGGLGGGGGFEDIDSRTWGRGGVRGLGWVLGLES